MANLGLPGSLQHRTHVISDRENCIFVVTPSGFKMVSVPESNPAPLELTHSNSIKHSSNGPNGRAALASPLLIQDDFSIAFSYVSKSVLFFAGGRDFK